MVTLGLDHSLGHFKLKGDRGNIEIHPPCLKPLPLILSLKLIMYNICQLCEHVTACSLFLGHHE